MKMPKLPKPRSDRDRAAEDFPERESASDAAARARREGHRRSIPETAAEGEAYTRDYPWGRFD